MESSTQTGKGQKARQQDMKWSHFKKKKSFKLSIFLFAENNLFLIETHFWFILIAFHKSWPVYIFYRDTFNVCLRASVKAVVK